MATTPEQATQVLATYANRNGWPVTKADEWVEALQDAHSVLLGWDHDELATLARKIGASKLPKSFNAAAYVTSLTGANVAGVLEQTTEAVAQDITGAAKTAAKGLPYVAPLAAVAAVVTLALLMNKGR
jgi:hypothetical protein